MNIELIKTRDLPDAWFQCVYHIFDKGYEYTIDRGSFKGQKRIEYDYIVAHISHPGTRPSITDIPPGCSVPPPTEEQNGTESDFSLDRAIIALLYLKQMHVKI